MVGASARSMRGSPSGAEAGGPAPQEADGRSPATIGASMFRWGDGAVLVGGGQTRTGTETHLNPDQGSAT
jgi:hypothetical protein